MECWKLRRILCTAVALVSLSQCSSGETTVDGGPGPFRDLGATWTGDGEGSGGASVPQVTGAGGSCAGLSCGNVVDGAQEVALDGTADARDAERDGNRSDGEVSDVPLVADIAQAQDQADAHPEIGTRVAAGADASGETGAAARGGVDGGASTGCLASGSYTVLGEAKVHGMDLAPAELAKCASFSSSDPAAKVTIEVADGVIRTTGTSWPPSSGVPSTVLIRAALGPDRIYTADWPSWTITTNTPEHLSAKDGIVCGTGPMWTNSFTLEVDCLARTLTLSGSCEVAWPSGCVPDYVYEVAGQTTLP